MMNQDWFDPVEKYLYFKNVRYNMDVAYSEFPKDNLKKKRWIPQQFYNLSLYPYNYAIKMEWVSNGAIFFDHVYLLEHTGFSDWFLDILEDEKYDLNEGFIRLWGESFNLLFNKVNLSDWSESEFLKPLSCTFEIIQSIVDSGINISRSNRKNVQTKTLEVLKKHRKEFILMQMGSLESQEYTELISQQIIPHLSN